MYPSQKVNLFGAYLDDSWSLSKRWNAYFGLRYDAFQGSPDSVRWAGGQSADYSSLSPKLNLSWKHDADTTTLHCGESPLAGSVPWRSFTWWAQNFNSGSGANPSYRLPLKPEQGHGL